MKELPTLGEKHYREYFECKCANQLCATLSVAPQPQNPHSAGLPTRAFHSMQIIFLTMRQTSFSADGKGGKVINRGKAGLFEAIHGRNGVKRVN